MAYEVICFDLEIRSKKGSREIELPKIKPNRNEEEEKKQILFENSTWKFVFSEAIPKRFSSIKVGLCIL